MLDSCIRPCTALLLAALLAPAAAAAIHRVDDTATGLANGTSWPDAFVTLQDALAAAAPGDEIWVAQGLYRPDQGSGQTAGDRTASFQLQSGVRLHGGFAGFETSLAQRAGLFAATLLSGDLNGDDGAGGLGDNSLHVVRGGGVDPTAWLDGFTVTAGNANVTFDDDAGGLLILSGSPTVRDCTFLRNRASDDGAAVTSRDASNPVFVRCTFIDNDAGDVGGAVWTHALALPTFVHCAFLGNRSGRLGGAIYQFHSGGQSVPIHGCLFSGNATVDVGGAIYVSGGAADVAGCTLAGNVAKVAGGLWTTSITTRVTGSILWGNTDATGSGQKAQLDGMPSGIVDHSCVQGWTGVLGGAGNHGADPAFTDADGPDGQVGTPDDDLHLTSGSPCADAGSNPAVPADGQDVDGDGDTLEPLPQDLAGDPRFQDDPAAPDTGAGSAPLVDMGALEGTGTVGVLAYGSGCPGSGGFIPALAVTGTPVAGAQVVLAISQGRGGATALLLFGLQQAAVPIGAGCTLNVTPVLPLQIFLPLGGAGPGAGSLILPATLPPGTAGIRFTMQAYVAEPLLATGFSNSNGLQLTIQ